MHELAASHRARALQPPLFTLESLSFVYPDGTPALRSITLDIHAGDRIALVGQNGAGKTTLARHLGGLLAPQRGLLTYRGRTISRDRLEILRSEAGMLFQDPDDHLFCPTLYEDVAFGPRNQGQDEAAVDEVVRDRLTAVGLGHLLFKPAHHLSFGQKKRAALAAILALNPEVLILDEPAANLDPRQEGLVRELLRAYDGTLIVIDHDLLFLYDICDRAIVLADGGVHHDFSFHDLVCQRGALREHGLDFTFRFSCCGHPDTPPHRHHHHLHPGTHDHGAAAGHLGDAGGEAALIELQHYSYRYPDGSPGVTDVNLAIRAGETVALVGENGAGKSTLAACLLGLHAGEGYVLQHGAVIDRAQHSRLWQRIGMVFQNAADQLFCPSCWDEVAFGPRQMGLEEAEVRSRVQEALDRVHLNGYGQRVPLNLSGGERKRLAIASALSMHPDLLILDEPTASLDPASQELLLGILAGLPMAILLITHDLFFIRSLSRRTLVMHQGRILRDYRTEAFLADDRLEEIIGLDYTYKNACMAEILSLRHEDERQTLNPGSCR